MTLFNAILLGIVQGLTEFLPISSDGHLAIAQYFLGLREPMLSFDVLLHIGSLLAILLYYRKRVFDLSVSLVSPRRVPEGRRLVLMIIVASIPTALVGLSFKPLVESLALSPAAVAMFWLLTAALLFAVARMTLGSKTIREIRVSDALLIGLFQGLAVLPGASRSGLTLAMGVMCGLHPKQAADFSFLIVIPAIFGAIFLQREDLMALAGPEQTVQLIGALTSAVVSFIAIWLLIKLLQRRVIQPFAWYLVAASAAVLIALQAGM